MTRAAARPRRRQCAVVGAALDRFDRRRLMLADNVVRGVLVALVPVLHLLGVLAVWQLYVFAFAYGLLKMVPLAGVPALIPELVPEERLEAANGLESVSFFLSSVVGAAVAGALIGAVGGANALWVDAASYAAFALALWRLGPVAPPSVADGDGGVQPIREALRFVVRTPVILATTLMFMSVNVGSGIVEVVTPVYVKHVLGAGPGTYGALLSVAAVAGLAGALLAGATGRWQLGRAIALSEIAAGGAYAGLAAKPQLALTFLVLAGAALFLGPLTVWAQTIRMRLIPAAMRGRVFGLLRTLMQATPPLGALLAAPLLRHGGIPAAGFAVAALLAVPAVAALALGPLRASA